MSTKLVFEIPLELAWTKPILEALSFPGESIEDTTQRIFIEALEEKMRMRTA